MRYARLYHDFQWMSYKSRTATPGWPGLPSTPETVPFFVSPNKSDKDDVKLNAAWDEYLQELNSERGYKFIISPPAGWFNRNKLADSLGFGGNVVEVLETVKNSAKIKTFNFKDNPPPADNWDFETHPELIHKFTVITKTGEVVNPANDIDVYTFVIGRGALYVPLVRIEFFPTLPMEISIAFTKSFGQEIKETPDLNGKTVGKYGPGKKVVIGEYGPRGVNVWGRTELGWIALTSYPANGQLKYLTSWKMKTIPPIPPR